MAVGLLLETPSLGLDMYEQVNQKMGIENDPPEGMIIHTAAQVGGNMRIFDVWESKEVYERFAEARLQPAMAEVMGEEAMQQGPEPELFELHNVAQP